ncbi:hypothetical protein DP939_37635 [Spongiactinospora rosea]|uniref:Uncharacterized protein n=1 Tax=Spongiactinospora rosea TaxID=2248750 RepID=A0A366LMG6_9ACTN|nr:hypothetical protein DP939_37635 [Spongiactinospora rosea]
MIEKSFPDAALMLYTTPGAGEVPQVAVAAGRSGVAAAAKGAAMAQPSWMRKCTVQWSESRPSRVTETERLAGTPAMAPKSSSLPPWCVGWLAR